jgi:hypothetical protein
MTGQLIIGAGGIGMQRTQNNNGIWFNSGSDTNHILWNDYYGGPTTRTGSPGGFDGIKWNTYRGIHIRGGAAGAYNCIVVTNSSGAENDHTVSLYAANVLRLQTTTSGVNISGNLVNTGTVTATSTGVDGTFANAFIAQYSGNNAETNAIQTAVSSAATQSGFRFQVSDGGGSSARTSVVDFLRDRANFYTRLQAIGAAVQTEGLLNISNTYASGGVYYPAAKFRNTRGDHSYGIVSEFSTGSTGGDRATVLFYSDSAAHSWQVGQVTAAWGNGDSFGIGYRANNAPSTFSNWPTNYFTIATGGNVGIGVTNPLAKLDVSGSIYVRTGNALYTDSIAGYSVGVVSLASATNFLVPSGRITIGTENTTDGRLQVRGAGVADATTTYGIILDRGTKIAWTNTGNASTGEYIYSQADSPYAVTIHSGGYNALACPNTSHVYINYEAGTCSIGSTSFSTSYKLYVTGQIYATSDITAYSDRRKKENITTIDNALDKVSGLRGVFYNRIDDESKKRNLGVIAQEVLEIVPEAVSYAEDTDEYGVKYGNLVGLLIEAIKEQQATIASQGERINSLEKLLKS